MSDQAMERGRAGGLARARALSPKQRSDIARDAAARRWGGGEKETPAQKAAKLRPRRLRLGAALSVQVAALLEAIIEQRTIEANTTAEGLRRDHPQFNVEVRPLNPGQVLLQLLREELERRRQSPGEGGG